MKTNKLRLVLKANAVFSMVSGLFLIILNQWVARVMNISSNSILIFLGIGLVLFGVHVYWNSVKENIFDKKIKLIIWQDWAWVIGSIAIIAMQAFGISQIGFLMIGMVALIVAVFAMLQQKYLKRTAE